MGLDNDCTAATAGSIAGAVVGPYVPGGAAGSRLGRFFLRELLLWLIFINILATLAVLIPSHLGVKADLLAPAPAGIKPEWYFLFVFQMLKYLPENIGLIMLGLGVFFVIAVPTLDRRAGRDQPSPIFTVVYVCLLVAAITLASTALTACQQKPEMVGGFEIPVTERGKFNVAMVLIGPHNDGGWLLISSGGLFTVADAHDLSLRPSALKAVQRNLKRITPELRDDPRAVERVVHLITGTKRP